MYVMLFTLALAAAPAAAEAPRPDRHAATRQVEAHEALIERHRQARHAAGALYQFAASRVVADRELAQRMAVDISSSLDTGQQEIDEIAELLAPIEREGAKAPLQELRDRQAQAVSHVGALKSALAATPIDGRQVRFLAGQIYEAVGQAHDTHQALMRQLNVKVADRSGPRVR